MGNSASFHKRIDTQEQYVNDNFESIRQRLSKKDYTDNQIRGKLRQEYHGYTSNDYIAQYRWKSVRT